MDKPTCVVPECDKSSRSTVKTYCPMHYHRIYRHGSLDANFSTEGKPFGTPRLYKTMYAKGHPTVGRNGKTYVHRKILYDAIGDGAHSCHWCSTEVRWFVGRGKTNNLVVDHLNDDKGDNRLENLVPTCNGCNAGRAAQKRHKVIKEKLGAWSGNDTVAALRNPKKRRRSPIVEEV